MIWKKLKIAVEQKIFSKILAGKGEKANFRWMAKQFFIKNGELSCIADKDRQVDIIHDIHEGSGHTTHSKAMLARLRRTPTYQKAAARFFWYGIYNDLADYLQKSDCCQRQSSLPPNVKNDMHSVPVSPHVIKQVVLDLFSLCEVDGCRHLIICIDYFTKWLEAKPIRAKTALTVATFFYELMCCHGCFEVQINDQGREFVNGVCPCLHDLTGIEQHITSAYHLQSNCLIEK